MDFNYSNSGGKLNSVIFVNNLNATDNFVWHSMKLLFLMKQLLKLIMSLSQAVIADLIELTNDMREKLHSEHLLLYVGKGHPISVSVYFSH